MNPIRAAKRFVYLFAAYVSVVGVITFSLFILEESIQMATFGTWPASDAQDWRLVRHGIDVIASANRTMKIINYGIGWIQPFAFLSYRAYGISTDYYLESMKAKIFAHDPGVMVGERVTVTIELRGGKVEQRKEGWLFAPKRDSVLVLFPFALIPQHVSFAQQISMPSIRVAGLVALDSASHVVLKVDLIHPVGW